MKKTLENFRLPSWHSRSGRKTEETTAALTPVELQARGGESWVETLMQRGTALTHEPQFRDFPGEVQSFPQGHGWGGRTDPAGRRGGILAVPLQRRTASGCHTSTPAPTPTGR